MTRLAVRVVPCLDVREGRVVKGVRFAGLRDAGDVLELGQAYESQGADELVLLDVSATPDGRSHALDVLSALRRRVGIPLTVGGGVRSVEDARALLRAGADRVGVNTAAVERPRILDELAAEFGVQCVVLALDAARRERTSGSAGSPWQVVTHSGSRRHELDAVAWAVEAARRGAGELLVTSWDRDGTGAGYDLELLTALCGTACVPVIASGGAAHPEHLVEAAATGASAVLAATVFHDGQNTVGDVKAALARGGYRVRSRS